MIWNDAGRCDSKPIQVGTLGRCDHAGDLSASDLRLEADRPALQDCPQVWCSKHERSVGKVTDRLDFSRSRPAREPDLCPGEKVTTSHAARPTAQWTYTVGRLFHPRRDSINRGSGVHEALTVLADLRRGSTSGASASPMMGIFFGLAYSGGPRSVSPVWGDFLRESHAKLLSRPPPPLIANWHRVDGCQLDAVVQIVP
jgi:hypothetical protein